MTQGDAEMIVKLILDTLFRNKLLINACRGQRYAGASVTAGEVSGFS